MARLRTPSVAICVGEGGSGGAMALGHADRLFMLPGSVFSVISPEGAAAILYRDTSRADELAGPLRLTSAGLTGLGIADGVLPELAAGRVGRLRRAVTGALGTAQPGDRDRRLATATRTFIADGPPGTVPYRSAAASRLLGVLAAILLLIVLAAPPTLILLLRRRPKADA